MGLEKKNNRSRIRRTHSDFDQTLSKIENSDDFSPIMIGLYVPDEKRISGELVLEHSYCIVLLTAMGRENTGKKRR